MISETTVQRVRELDIADVVKPYTELRRHGSEFSGCARSIPKEQPLSPYLRQRTFATATAAARAATAYSSQWRKRAGLLRGGRVFGP